MEKWKNAGGANITFNFVSPSQAGGGATTGGPPILSIMRQVPTNLGPTAQGETRGFSFNGNRGDSFMDINPGVTADKMFFNVWSQVQLGDDTQKIGQRLVGRSIEGGKCAEDIRAVFTRRDVKL